MSDLLLPVGSQVVTRATAVGTSDQTLAPHGAVGVIIARRRPAALMVYHSSTSSGLLPGHSR